MNTLEYTLTKEAKREGVQAPVKGLDVLFNPV
jgi:hypothetical protein